MKEVALVAAWGVGAGVAVLALLGGVVAVEAAGPGPRPTATGCAAPALAGTVVDVEITEAPAAHEVVSVVPVAPPAAGVDPARVLLSAGTVPAGLVSLRVRNHTAVPRELVVLPLPARTGAGARPALRDGRVNQAGVMATASADCGAGAGAGIPPGGLGWVGVVVAAGSVELVCNGPGEYAAGARATLGTRPVP